MAYEAVAKEAAELYQRYHRASQTEKARIQDRAGQLLGEHQHGPR